MVSKLTRKDMKNLIRGNSCRNCATTYSLLYMTPRRAQEFVRGNKCEVKITIENDDVVVNAPAANICESWKENFRNDEDRIDLLGLMKKRHPKHVFSTSHDKKLGHTILLIDGKYSGAYDIMNKDVNSYNAGDSLSMAMDMIDKQVKEIESGKS